MARCRLLRRARPAHLLAGLALMSSVGVPLLETPSAIAAGPAPVAPGSARGDFNNDGFADLAIGVPLEGATFSMQGAVQVIYGSPSGLNPVAAPGHPGEQLLLQPDPWPQTAAGFGLALAVGDFNGDDFGDLAVGANGEDIGEDGQNEGSVTVFYGSAGGLASASAQRLTEATPTQNNQFGFYLAAGDFDGDTDDELAVGILNAAVNGVEKAGAALIYAGTPAGLDAANPVQLDADKPGTEGKASPWAQFGSVLATGDVNADGRMDLAVGAPGDTVKGYANAGSVHVFFGCATGADCRLLNTATDQFITQSTPGVNGSAESGDFFGIALAMANFGRGPGDDVAVGTHSEDLKDVAGAGAVQVFYSNGATLDLAGGQFFAQGLGGLPDTPEEGDQFGAVLAAGNIGKSAEAELVIGSPFEDLDGPAGPLLSAGTVTVLYGSPAGLWHTNELITQNSPNIPSEIGAAYGFGKSLTIANFGFSRVGDLAIASRDTVNGQVAAGAVTVLYGGTGAIVKATTIQYWTQESLGVSDTAEAGDLFGGVFGQPGLTG
jgi:FG-GAP repeat